MITLYGNDANGKTRHWSIQGDQYTGTIFLEYGLYKGKLTGKRVHVTENSSGRTLAEQVDLEVNSRIDKMRRKGFSESIPQEGTQRKNSLKLPLPMLAQTYENERLKTPYFLQRKYNGNRCLITKRNGVMMAYSRGGKPLLNIEHILEDASSIEEGVVLDGELYHHGTPLQTINSWIKRKSPDSGRIKYIMYDIITDEPYSKRLERLKSLTLGSTIDRAGTKLITGSHDLISELEKAIRDGYEGLMIRKDGKGYETGKRSNSLLKVKSWKDCELRVVDIRPSSDGWAILDCFFEGKTVSVTCPGTMEFKKNVMDNKYKYIGEFVTIKYAELTEDGIPFHPVAVSFRDQGDF